MASGPVDKRLNYFDGQFLQAKDFIAEQTYHMERQRLANRTFHTPGVMDGLEIESADGFRITVRSGAAMDAEGRLIVLFADRNVDLPTPSDSTNEGWTWDVVISYNETESDPQGEGGYTRRLEKPSIELLEHEKYDKDIKIELGKVTVSAQGKITDCSIQGRLGAGIRVGGKLELEELGLTSDAGASYLRSGAGDRVDLEGDLYVKGVLRVNRRLILEKSNQALPGGKTTEFVLDRASESSILDVQVRATEAKAKFYWFLGRAPNEAGQQRPAVFFHNEESTAWQISFEVYELEISGLSK